MYPMLCDGMITIRQSGQATEGAEIEISRSTLLFHHVEGVGTPFASGRLKGSRSGDSPDVWSFAKDLLEG